MSRKELLSAFKVWFKSQGFSKHSIEASILSVKLFFEHCDDSENIIEINPDVIKEYAGYLNKTKHIAYVCHEIASIKLFYNFLYFKKWIQKNPFDEIDIIDICELGD